MGRFESGFLPLTLALPLLYCAASVRSHSINTSPSVKAEGQALPRPCPEGMLAGEADATLLAPHSKPQRLHSEKQLSFLEFIQTEPVFQPPQLLLPLVTKLKIQMATGLVESPVGTDGSPLPISSGSRSHRPE